MAYVISCILNGTPHAIQADQKNNKFHLIPVLSETDLSKVLSHPQKTGIISILKWIQENDEQLSKHGLSIQDEQLYRK
jgi:hypothetical protein